MDEERLISLDILRILATFAVIILHVAASGWDKFSVDSLSWQMINIYDGSVRWAVPIFVMISGCFFLNERKELSLKKLYGKYILRLITAFLFWSMLYAVCYILVNRNGLNSHAVLVFLKQTIEGHYHLWFIYMMIGLYMITPFLRKIVQSQILMRYFLLLAYIFAIMAPFIAAFPGLNYSAVLIGKTYMYFVIGYPIYYMMGYYLHTCVIGKIKWLIYLAGVVGLVMTILGTTLVSGYLGAPSTIFYEHFTPNCFAVSMAIFVLFHEEVSRLKITKAARTRIIELSRDTFGVYLIHDLYRACFDRLGLPFFLTISWSIPLTALLIGCCSFLTIHFMRKISSVSRFVL